jgi:ERCC4-type nuclease
MSATDHTTRKPTVVFLVDTREQRPLEFGPPIRTDHFSGATTHVTMLREGDYAVSLDGATPLSIRLERKSLGDLYACIGLHRDRFEAELKRLREYDYRGIIIEATLGEFAAGYHRSQISPRAALGSLCAWAVRHHLAVWFAGDHRAAAAIVQRLLEAFAIDVLRRDPAPQAARTEDAPRTLLFAPNLKSRGSDEQG